MRSKPKPNAPTTPPSMLRVAPLGTQKSSPTDWVALAIQRDQGHLRQCVTELNERFRQAGYPLHYHNGFIQFSDNDDLPIEVEEPFWSLVSAAPWQNVDMDMKEALHRRDAGGRDPAFFAARALESAIKIISKMKGWSSGNEKGAYNYIEKLAAKKNAFITPWESNILKEYFSSVRNPLSHGPGDGAMPSLSPIQTQWAIEFAMIWTKSLIKRL